MSDQLERINTGGLTIAPGVEVVLGTDIEPIRGRVLYLESGGLVVTPMVDSPVWLGGAALGGSPDIAPAGEAVKLEPGTSSSSRSSLSPTSCRAPRPSSPTRVSSQR